MTNLGSYFVRLVCLECSKRFKSRNSVDPRCPKCGGVDVDLDYPQRSAESID